VGQITSGKIPGANLPDEFATSSLTENPWGAFSLFQGVAHYRMNDSFEGKRRNIGASLRAVL
jgi:hypothetical protein